MTRTLLRLLTVLLGAMLGAGATCSGCGPEYGPDYVAMCEDHFDETRVFYEVCGLTYDDSYDYDCHVFEDDDWYHCTNFNEIDSWYEENSAPARCTCDGDFEGVECDEFAPFPSCEH